MFNIFKIIFLIHLFFLLLGCGHLRNDDLEKNIFVKIGPMSSNGYRIDSSSIGIVEFFFLEYDSLEYFNTIDYGKYFIRQPNLSWIADSIFIIKKIALKKNKKYVIHTAQGDKNNIKFNKDLKTYSRNKIVCKYLYKFPTDLIFFSTDIDTLYIVPEEKPNEEYDWLYKKQYINVD